MPAQNPYDLCRRQPVRPLALRPLVLAADHRHHPRPGPQPVLRPRQRAAGSRRRCPGVPQPVRRPASRSSTRRWSTARPTRPSTVEPKAYRFRILNAANDRFWNLQLYVAADKNSPTTEGTTGAVLCDDAGVPASRCTEVKMVPAAPTAGLPGHLADRRPRRRRARPGHRAARASIQIGTEGGFLPAPAVIAEPADHLEQQPDHLQLRQRRPATALLRGAGRAGRRDRRLLAATPARP